METYEQEDDVGSKKATENKAKLNIHAPWVETLSIDAEPRLKLFDLDNETFPIPLKYVDVMCKHYTKPTHTSHSRTRDFFSRGSRIESSSQQESLCLTKQSLFTSGTACRTRPRCCFLHTWAPPHFPHALQSSPTIYQTLLMSISHGDLSCEDPSNVSFGSLAETHSPTDYESKDLTEEHISRGQTKVLPQTEHDVDLWFSWELCDSSPESDLNDEQIRNMLAYTAVLTGERRKGRPNTSSSLLQRKLCVKFTSFPSKCRETCSCVLTLKKVESRISLRQRRYFLRTSSSSRRKWSSVQTLWIGKCCEINSWRTKRSSTLRGKIWSTEARMQVRCSRLFYSWTSKTNSFQSSGGLTILTLEMKHLEESRPDFTKNWHSEKGHFEKLRS